MTKAIVKKANVTKERVVMKENENLKMDLNVFPTVYIIRGSYRRAQNTAALINFLLPSSSVLDISKIVFGT